jgi:hypothetical protein
MTLHRIAVIFASLSLVACDGGGDDPRDSGGDPPEEDAGTVPVTGLPILGDGTHAIADVDLTVIATEANDIVTPRDIEINPHDPTEAWVVNQEQAVVILFDWGTAEQRAQWYSGFGSSHFLTRPAALAFGQEGFMATAPEMDDITQPSTPADFMGPTLWSSNSAAFDAGHATHLDMLHNSPNSAGIAWDSGNIYWVFDGAHEALTRYDFQLDHGPGGEDHSDGIAARFVEGQVGYVENVSSHMEMDHASGLLYVADTGNNRIAVLDPRPATRGASIGPNYDGGEQYAMTGAQLTTLIDGADVEMMQRPSGLVLDGDRIFVTDNMSSRVYAFDKATGALLDYLDLSPMVAPGGLMGLDVAADGTLVLVDAVGDRIFRLRARTN